MPRKQTNYAASSAAVGRGMVKPRAPGLGDEVSNKVAQLRDIITRLRGQVAAADKLAAECEATRAAFGSLPRPLADALHAYLASRAP